MRCACCESEISSSSWELSPLVFSDCQEWPGPSATYGRCICGHLQKHVSDRYWSSILAGYSTYSPYIQGGGQEQRVVAGASSELAARSEVIVSALTERGVIPRSGNHLDFGAGSGVLLRTLNSRLPEASLHAADIGTQHFEKLEMIPGVVACYDSAEPLPQDVGWTAVWMIHVVEHLTTPVETLREIAQGLQPGGVVVIQVPSFLLNPFDLTIADHVSHFTEASLLNLLSRSGLQLVAGPLSIVNKELTVVATNIPASADTEPRPHVARAASQSDVDRAFGFLSGWTDLVRQGCQEELGLSIFGSSIAAGWVASLMREHGRTPQCFIDDDPNRQGSSFRGVRILGAHELPSTSTLLVPLVSTAQEGVLRRFKADGVRCQTTPEWTL